MRCCGAAQQHRRGVLPHVPALFKLGEKGSRSRVKVTILNCIDNHPSLFLQRVYSEISPQNCAAATLSPVRPPLRLAEIHYPLPTAGPFRTRHRPKYAM